LFSGQVQKQLEGLHESRDQEAERPRGSRESPDEAVHRRLAGRGMDVHRGESRSLWCCFQGLWDLQQARWERGFACPVYARDGEGRATLTTTQTPLTTTTTTTPPRCAHR